MNKNCLYVEVIKTVLYWNVQDFVNNTHVFAKQENIFIIIYISTQQYTAHNNTRNLPSPYS